MIPYYQKLLPNNTYHLFTRAVGSEKLFLSSDNYLFFLKKLNLHTSPVCNIYCYTLLPNHFHLLAKIKDDKAIIQHFEKVKKRNFDPLNDDISDFLMERFSNLLNSYTKAFNKREKRKGSLFMDYLRRSVVNKESDFTNYVWYIHKNAVHHQLTKKIGEWTYDSYQSLLSTLPTNLLRHEVMEWFGNKELFIQFHQQKIHPKIEIEDI